jgi:uncharacterized protein YjbI with pentapeptide repeats
MKQVGRKFLLLLILQHKKELSRTIQNHFDGKILLHDLDFTGADLRGIHQDDFLLFDLTNCKLDKVKIDRSGLDYFLKYFRSNAVTYEGVELAGEDLGRRLISRPDVGVLCNIATNLSNLNLKGANFNGCSLEDVLFDGCNLEGATFLNAKFISPEQFAFTSNFNKTIFFQDPAQNTNFINQISQIKSKGKPEEEDFQSAARYKIAGLFDPIEDKFKVE